MVRLGESVAVDGVCLTVVEPGGATSVPRARWFAETLDRTTLGRAQEPGDGVNLERARCGWAIGSEGHLVLRATWTPRARGPGETSDSDGDDG